MLNLKKLDFRENLQLIIISFIIISYFNYIVKFSILLQKRVIIKQNKTQQLSVAPLHKRKEHRLI